LKRLTAILLLLIVIFNLYGYRLMISYLQEHSSAQVETRIDHKDYNEAELISIKTTLNLPYYNSSPVFERVYGSIHLNGVDYEYVMRRVYNDTLEVLCLPNHKKTALNTMSNDMAKGLSNDASTPAKKATLKIVLPDYCQSLTYVDQNYNTKSSIEYFLSSTRFLSANYSLRQEKPPKFDA